MTKRIAIFVEGLTEQEFTSKLLIKLAGTRGVTLDIHKQKNGVMSFVELRSQAKADFYVLIGNCDTDNQVKSQIISNYSSLVAKGYSLIIGLRDTYPIERAEIPNLKRLLSAGLPSGSIQIDMHLAITETEAWFLEELSHFQRIHNNITTDVISTNGFDSGNILASDLEHPAETLHTIYKTVGLAYRKTGKQITRTINALSYDEICTTVRFRDVALNSYIASIEKGLF